MGITLRNYYFSTVSSSVKTAADRHRLAALVSSACYDKHCWRAFHWCQHRWPWTTLNPKNRGFWWIFSDFRLPYTFYEWIAPTSFKIDQDNLQMKCSALNVDLNCVMVDPRAPRFKESSIRVHQIWVSPWKRAMLLLLSTNLAREWLQIDTDMLRIITSTADELSGGTNIDDLERCWTPQNKDFSEFLAIFRLQYTF